MTGSPVEIRDRNLLGLVKKHYVEALAIQATARQSIAERRGNQSCFSLRGLSGTVHAVFQAAHPGLEGLALLLRAS